jgi:hypothetical protein
VMEAELRASANCRSPRPYRTADRLRHGFTGFHPGLFSLAPSGSRGERGHEVGEAVKEIASRSRGR